MVRIRAKSAVMAWPIWVVEVCAPINVDGNMERVVRFVNSELRGTIFGQEEAKELLPFVLKVRPEAEIVPVETPEGGEA